MCIGYLKHITIWIYCVVNINTESIHVRPRHGASVNTGMTKLRASYGDICACI